MENISLFTSCKNIFSKINAFICNPKKEKVWSFALFGSLIIYFLLTISAYAEWFPGSTKYFAFNTTSGMIIRGLVSVFVIVCCSFCYVYYRKEINKKWFYPFIFLIVISFIMIFVTQTSYETLYRTTKLYDFMAVYKTSVSFNTNFTMYISFVLDIVFGFCFVFIIPKSIKNYWYYIILISLFLLIMFYSCCYSFIKEKDYYVYFMHGDWHYQADSIGSIFGNKQQWGVFLAPAFICCFFNIYLFFKTNANKVFKFLFLGACLLICFCCFLCGLVAFCKTAIVADILAISILAIGIAVFLFYKRKWVIGVGCTFLIMTIGLYFLLVYTVPSLHESGIGKKIFDLINSLLQNGQTGAESRYEIMRSYFQNFPGVNLMFGFPKGTQDAYVRALIPEMVNGLHSGIAIYFGRTGIFGSVIYIILFVLLIIKSCSCFKRKPFYFFLVLAGLVSSFILNLSELEILIMSSSATVFMYNVICVMLPFSIDKQKENVVYAI